jgi:hypothetical protein
MKTFKFFQKEIRKFSLYEKTVLNMIVDCISRSMNPVGYSHPFVIREIFGFNHKRIVIRHMYKSISDFPRIVYIEYDVHVTNYSLSDSVISHTMEIFENELQTIIEMTP